jgi:hypothetical protein
MLPLLATGETDATVLAEEARGRLPNRKAGLKEALAGKPEPVYRRLLKQTWSK